MDALFPIIRGKLKLTYNELAASFHLLNNFAETCCFYHENYRIYMAPFIDTSDNNLHKKYLAIRNMQMHAVALRK